MENQVHKIRSILQSTQRVIDKTPYLYWVLAAAIGWTIGVLAWGSGRSAELAAIVPLVIALAATRTQAFLVGAFYVLAAGRDRPEVMASWYDKSILVGLGMLILVAGIAGLSWSLCWTSSQKPWRKSLACMLGWAVLLLPPVGAITPGNVVVAWGYITPHWGWIGVALSAIVPAMLVWLISSKGLPRKYTVGLVSVIAAILIGASFTYLPVENRYINDIVAINTKLGSAKDPYDVINRIERIGKTNSALANDHLASVIVYPESILQTYDPSLFPVLDIEVLKNAIKAGQTIVLGADIPTKEGNFKNAAIAFYPDGKSATVIARQPVPVALWKPWKTSGSFDADWRANNILTLRDGIKARVIFCYEEYLPILSLINEARDDHQMVVVMSNTWSASEQLASDIQNRHSEGIARLFGRKIIKAENRPKG